MSKISVDPYGNLHWRNAKGEYHREDGPAVIWADGTKSWYLNGERHRENGPALIYPSGYKEWWTHGKFIKSEES